MIKKLTVYFPPESGSTKSPIILSLFLIMWVLIFLNYLIKIFRSLVSGDVVAYFAVSVIVVFFGTKKRRQFLELIRWMYSGFNTRVQFVVHSFFYGMFEGCLKDSVKLEKFIIRPFIIFCVYLVSKSLYDNLKYGDDVLLSIVLPAYIIFYAIVIGFVISAYEFGSVFYYFYCEKLGFKVNNNTIIITNNTNDCNLKVAHISDLHIPHADNVGLTEKAPWDSAILDRCIVRLKNSGDLDAIVISGDITDTGHKDAWNKFEQKFDDFKGKIIFAPGNHDLNIVGYGIPSLFLVADKNGMDGRWYRMENYMNAAVKFMGNAKVIENKELVGLATSWGKIQGSGENSSEKHKMASRLFPILVDLNGCEKTKCIIWNTVRTSELAINNSYGLIDEEQINNYRSIASKFNEDVSFIHVMHHKLAFPEEKLIFTKHKVNRPSIGLGLLNYLRLRLQTGGMIMQNPRSVVNALLEKNTGKKTVILHGHHHASFFGKIVVDKDKSNVTELHVVSAPSTTLGVESRINPLSKDKGFYILEIDKTNGLVQMNEIRV